MLSLAMAGGVSAATDDCGRFLDEREWDPFQKECLNDGNKIRRYAGKAMAYFRSALRDADEYYLSPAHIDYFLAKMEAAGLLREAQWRPNLCETVSLMEPRDDERRNKKQAWHDKIGCANPGAGTTTLKDERDSGKPERDGLMDFLLFLLFLIVAYLLWFVWNLRREIRDIRKYSDRQETANRKREADIIGVHKGLENRLAALEDAVEIIRNQIQTLQNPPSDRKAIARVEKKTGWDALYERLLAADTRQEIEKVLLAAQAEYDFRSAIGAVGRPSGKEGLYFFNTKITDEDNRGLYVIINPKKGLYYLIPCGIRNRVTNPWLNLLYTIDKDTIAIRRLKSPTQIKIVKTADDNTADNLIYFSLGKTGELL